MILNIMKLKDKCIQDAIYESNGLFIASKISNCCKGIRKKAGNFKWQYFKDIVQSSEKSEIIS